MSATLDGLGGSRTDTPGSPARHVAGDGAGPAPTQAPTAPVRPRSGAAPFGPVLRFELAKILGQWRVRVVLVACLVLPGVLVGVVSHQAGLPTDTVFGRWLPSSGWAGSLVVLAVACSWGLPLLTSLVAGDVFAVEDRLGTWRHLVVTVRSPRRVFAAKVLAALLVVLLLVTALAVSGTVGGLVASGDHPLVGLDGRSIGTGEAARTVALAWVCVLAPTLALACVGLLGSVAAGRSPVGLLAPAVLALVSGLVLVLPVPVGVRLALPSNAFLAWRGLFTSPAQTGQLVVGIAVSLVWAAVATGAAYAVLVRRDLGSPTGPGPRTQLVAWLPLVALVALGSVAVPGLATLAGLTGPGGPSGITRARLEQSTATAFAHLYRLQTAELHRPDVTERQLRSTASCDKGGPRVADSGPGHDWRCTVSWRLPGSTAVGYATFSLDVAADGRWVADGDGPKEVNGSFTVRTPWGDAPNPLWQVDGHVDLL
ncbi:ABC transporter permease [Nocardioides korecus]